MCFLLLHHQTRQDAPLVLLANRDESFDRPFEPPALRDPVRGVWAPKDLRAGGTWLGVNGQGVVVALTNRGQARFDGVRSRGLLVDDALCAGTADGVVAWARGHLAQTPYAGFNLLAADGAAAWVVRHPGRATPTAPADGDVVALRPGSHVLTNLHDLDEVPTPALGLPRADEPLEATLTRLRELATDDRTPLPGDHRILKRGAGRGTVCSAVLALGGRGQRAFEFANGRPGEAPFVAVGW